MFKYALYIYSITFCANICCVKCNNIISRKRQLRQMPLHHRVSYNSDSSLRPNEDNLLLILKLVYNKKILGYMSIYSSDKNYRTKYSPKPNVTYRVEETSSGPKGLRSLGSPVMSRLLYQAELWALRKSKLTCAIK